MTERTPVHILRVPMTTPCPLRVAPDGSVLDDAGELLPDEQRTEFCAVDAQWMMGAGQMVCDVHLRDVVDRMDALEGSFEDIVRDAYAAFGEAAVEQALEKAARPWSERTRYTQSETAKWVLP